MLRQFADASFGIDSHVHESNADSVTSRCEVLPTQSWRNVVHPGIRPRSRFLETVDLQRELLIFDQRQSSGRCRCYRRTLRAPHSATNRQ